MADANSLCCCFVADEASFDMESNKLTGPIPTELGIQVDMCSFEVASNMLTGTLPTEIGELSKLGKLS